MSGRVYKALSDFWDNYEDKWSVSPDWVAQRIYVKQPVDRLESPAHDTPKLENHTRFVCISDTHSRELKITLPPGDVLLHAGDMTKIGSPGEFTQFSKLMESLPYKYKVVIPGNHELGLDPTAGRRATYGFKKDTRQECIDNMKHCLLLEDQWVKINGIKIYGSPWQPEFCEWAYNLDRGPQLQNVWKKIPDDTDVLMTHGPPIRHGDMCSSGLRAGCVDLLRTIQTRVHPKYHVFGHVHEDPGITTDGKTVYINASTCNRQYRAVQECIIFDLPNITESGVFEMGPKNDIVFPGTH